MLESEEGGRRASVAFTIAHTGAALNTLRVKQAAVEVGCTEVDKMTLRSGTPACFFTPA